MSALPQRKDECPDWMWHPAFQERPKQLPRAQSKDASCALAAAMVYSLLAVLAIVTVVLAFWEPVALFVFYGVLCLLLAAVTGGKAFGTK